MAQYTWWRDVNSGTCLRIECDSNESACRICDHLNGNNVRCSVSGITVDFEEHPSFLEVIRVSEAFIGTRLISG